MQPTLAEITYIYNFHRISAQSLLENACTDSVATTPTQAIGKSYLEILTTGRSDAMSNTYKAVEIREYGSQSDPASGIAIAERPVPAPGAGQVLVRLFLRPINPSDLMSLAGAAALLSRRASLSGNACACLASCLRDHYLILHGICTAPVTRCRRPIDTALWSQATILASNPRACPSSQVWKVSEHFPQASGVCSSTRSITAVLQCCDKSKTPLVPQVSVALKQMVRAPPDSAKASASCPRAGERVTAKAHGSSIAWCQRTN